MLNVKDDTEGSHSYLSTASVNNIHPAIVNTAFLVPKPAGIHLSSVL